jgi:hypothetical protein
MYMCLCAEALKMATPSQQPEQGIQFLPEEVMEASHVHTGGTKESSFHRQGLTWLSSAHGPYKDPFVVALFRASCFCIVAPLKAFCFCVKVPFGPPGTLSPLPYLWPWLSVPVSMTQFDSLLPWRWRQHFPSEHCSSPAILHSVIAQKATVWISHFLCSVQLHKPGVYYVV